MQASSSKASGAQLSHSLLGDFEFWNKHKYNDKYKYKYNEKYNDKYNYKYKAVNTRAINEQAGTTRHKNETITRTKNVSKTKV